MADYLIIALIVLVLIVVGLIGLALTRPTVFRVQRSLAIKAPRDEIYGIISDLHQWPAWSPWEKLDPAMKKTYGGTPYGLGAFFEWEGNKKAGAGRSEIIEAESPSHIKLKLDFSRPFACHNFVDYTLEPEGDATKVTWAMHGPSPLMARFFSLFINMESIVGKDFETGLASLKALAEK